MIEGSETRGRTVGDWARLAADVPLAKLRSYALACARVREVAGNPAAWGSDLARAHREMRDALEALDAWIEAVALSELALDQQRRAAQLAFVEQQHQNLARRALQRSFWDGAP